MSDFALDAAWLAALRGRADAPPVRPRVPLFWRGARFGSAEPGVMRALGLAASLATETEGGWHIHGDDLSTCLHAVALAMRDAGVAHAWRDEQLAVTSESGESLGTVERAVVRPLGIQTFAVHLAGLAPDGRHWVQQRSLTKANDPGLWDTLMGGMIPASDSTEQALARETWEEAGLRMQQLRGLGRGGGFLMRRPTDAGLGGYVVEHIEWYRCFVPSGVVPENRDGEVQQFRLMTGEELGQRLQRDEFTLEAALVLVALESA